MRLLLTILLVVSAVISCRNNTQRLGGYAVHGIDVSRYQLYVNWDLVSTQEVQFAFVKATEGATLTDSLFARNWSELERVGMLRGAYHFFRPTTEPVSQALNFLNAVVMKEGDLPPVLDVEVLDGVDEKTLVGNIKIWLAEVEVFLGIRPIIYSNQKFYNRYLAGHFPDHHLWIARYNRNKPELDDNRDWFFWQYGDRGQMQGISGFVDFNVFRGSYQDLLDLCLQPIAPPLSLSYSEQL